MLYRVRVLAALATAATLSLVANAQSLSADELSRMPGFTLSNRADALSQGVSGGSISGTVRGIDNRPINNAHVQIRDLMSGQDVASGQTNLGGTFAVSSLPSGNYEVTVTSGLSQQHEQISVRGMPVQLEMRLPNAGPAADTASGNRSSVSVQEMRVPGKAKDALRKAREAAEKGKTDEAHAELAKALEIEPRYSEALAFRGVLEMQSGDLSGAENSLNEAIRLDSNNALAYIAIGSLYNHQKRYDDAKRHIERAIVLDPNTWQGYFELSKANLGRGEYEAGLKQIDRAQALIGKHDFGPMHIVKGQLLVGIKAFGAAVNEFQSFLTKDASSPAAPEVRQALDQAKAFADNAPR